jgi:hypothetical protein
MRDGALGDEISFSRSLPAREPKPARGHPAHIEQDDGEVQPAQSRGHGLSWGVFAELEI